MNLRVLKAFLLATAVFAAALCGGCGRPQGAATSPAPQSPPPAVKGIRQVGSTTLLPLAERWRSEFAPAHPNVSLIVSGGGSGSGIKAFIDRSAQLANSSREFTPEEIRQAKAVGVMPVAHLVARDGIAIIVNPANPLTQLPLEKLSDLYAGKITNWDALGAKGLGPVQLVGRDPSSGTRDVFRQMVVRRGGENQGRGFAAGTLEQSSNQGVLAKVELTKGAIGYVGLGYVNDKVKVLKVIPVGGNDAIAPTVQTVQSKQYPLSRALYCYTDGEPAGDLKAYVDYMLSEAGQRVVAELGFVPVKAASAVANDASGGKAK